MPKLSENKLQNSTISQVGMRIKTSMIIYQLGAITCINKYIQ